MTMLPKWLTKMSNPESAQMRTVQR